MPPARFQLSKLLITGMHIFSCSIIYPLLPQLSKTTTQGSTRAAYSEVQPRRDSQSQESFVPEQRQDFSRLLDTLHTSTSSLSGLIARVDKRYTRAVEPLCPINGPKPTVDFRKRADSRHTHAVNVAGTPPYATSRITCRW